MDELLIPGGDIPPERDAGAEAETEAAGREATETESFAEAEAESAEVTGSETTVNDTDKTPIPEASESASPDESELSPSEASEAANCEEAESIRSEAEVPTLSDVSAPIPSEATELEQPEVSGQAISEISESAPSQASEQSSNEMSELRAEVERLRAELNERLTAYERMTREYEEFREIYPDREASELSRQVWDDVRRGIPLAAAYAYEEAKARRREELAAEINRKNNAVSAGALHSGAGSDYFSPDEVRAMSAAEVRNNYEKIMASMKSWS